MKKLLPILFLVLMMPMAFAEIDFDQDITPEEEEAFDKMLSPVMKIYNFIKYAASVIGVIMLVFAGVMFATAGSETRKKDGAKNMAAGVIIGLIVIWVAPLVVNYILS